MRSASPPTTGSTRPRSSSPLALGASALFAFVTGLVSLRTRGVYFIMITLAFAQMIYFAFVSIEEYGGDDGLVIDLRSEMGGIADLESGVQLYYAALTSLVLVTYLVRRVVRSRFGLVLRGSRDKRRAHAGPRLQHVPLPPSPATSSRG